MLWCKCKNYIDISLNICYSNPRKNFIVHKEMKKVTVNNGKGANVKVEEEMRCVYIVQNLCRL